MATVRSGEYNEPEIVISLMSRARPGSDSADVACIWLYEKFVAQRCGVNREVLAVDAAVCALIIRTRPVLVLLCVFGNRQVKIRMREVKTPGYRIRLRKHGLQRLVSDSDFAQMERRVSKKDSYADLHVHIIQISDMNGSMLTGRTPQPGPKSIGTLNSLNLLRSRPVFTS